MLNRRLALAAIALLVSASAALTQNSDGYSQQPGACGYYTNRAGHMVPRPCGDWHNHRTSPGATALCADGRYSYSEHPYAHGTCSHHGGVVQHLQ